MKSSTWSGQIIEEIEKIMRDLNQKQKKKYKLLFLERVVHRIDYFSNEGCNECEQYKAEIRRMLDVLSDGNELKGERLSNYRVSMKKIVKHLQKEHKLIEEGTYMTQFMVLGLLIGAAFISYFSWTVAIGFSLGLLIGSSLDARAKGQGKVI